MSNSPKEQHEEQVSHEDKPYQRETATSTSQHHQQQELSVTKTPSFLRSSNRTQYCDRMEIAYPQMIQSFGTLFVIETKSSNYKIHVVSENASQYLDLQATQLLNTSFLHHLDPISIQNVLSYMNTQKLTSPSMDTPFVSQLIWKWNRKCYNYALHEMVDRYKTEHEYKTASNTEYTGDDIQKDVSKNNHSDFIIIELQLAESSVNMYSEIYSEQQKQVSYIQEHACHQFPLLYSSSSSQSTSHYTYLHHENIDSEYKKNLESIHHLWCHHRYVPGNQFIHPFQFLSTIDRFLSEATSKKDLFCRVVDIFGTITNYDRINLYQLDEEWNGHVVCELLKPGCGLDAYENLHFPSTDIPEKVRELYKKLRVIVIQDLDTKDSPLRIHSQSPLSQQPLDISSCYLRAIHPIHKEFCKNMRISSTISIAFITNNRLWGVVSMHSIFPHSIPFQNRNCLTSLSFVISRHLERSENIRRIENYASQKILGLLGDTFIMDFPNVPQPDIQLIMKFFSCNFCVLHIDEDLQTFALIHPSKADDYVFQEMNMDKQKAMNVCLLVQRVFDHRRLSNSFEGNRKILYSRCIAQDFPSLYKEADLGNFAGFMYVPFHADTNKERMESNVKQQGKYGRSGDEKIAVTKRSQKSGNTNEEGVTQETFDSSGSESILGQESRAKPLSESPTPENKQQQQEEDENRNISYILLLRKEVQYPIEWAGDPSSQERTTYKNETILEPRKSFQTFREMIAQRSNAWSLDDINNAKFLSDHLSRLLTLRHLKVKAENASSLKTVMLGSLAHEVKTPLSAVINYLHLARNLTEKYISLGMGDSDLLDVGLFSLHDLMDKALGTSQSLVRILNQLLVGVFYNSVLRLMKSESSSKLSSDSIETGFEFIEEPFSIKDCFEKSIQMADIHPNPAKVKVDIYVDPKIPKIVYGDIIKTQQILCNLYVNSVKHTFEGFIRLNATLEKQQKNDASEKTQPVSQQWCLKGMEDTGWMKTINVCFTVEDSGEGIPKEDLPKIFKAFEQFSSKRSGKRPQGYGLGLSIVSQLVKCLKGSINVESELNKGTVLKINIPLHVIRADFRKLQSSHTETQEVSSIIPSTASTHQQSLSVSSNQPTTSFVSFSASQQIERPNFSNEQQQAEEQVNIQKKKKKILIAEDDFIAQMVMQRKLEPYFDCTYVNNGQECYERFVQNIEKNEPFDVILTDLEMPVCSGFKCSKKIREYESNRFMYTQESKDEQQTEAYLTLSPIDPRQAESSTTGSSQQSIPIIAMSGHDLDDVYEKCLLHGIKGFVAKPIDYEKLKDMLNK